MTKEEIRGLKSGDLIRETTEGHLGTVLRIYHDPESGANAAQVHWHSGGVSTVPQGLPHYMLAIEGGESILSTRTELLTSEVAL